MNLVTGYFRDLGRGATVGWNRFWFTPADPTTLCAMRMLSGALLLYTHLVWTLDLEGFFGVKGWCSPSALALFPDSRVGVWSHLYLLHSPAALWTAHIVALVILAMYALGLFTRVTAVLAWLITVSYANRLIPQALFGLDDINAMLVMYLMLGPCGQRFSLDAWLRGRTGEGRGARLSGTTPTVAANFAIRLVQVHMCVVYFFSALGKLMGASWWGGSALWLAAGNLEYQSLDLTWLAHVPLLVNLLTHLTVYWELSYCALVWPRLTRPLMLAMAVIVHGGIGLFLGMQTFGLAMIIGNFAFVSPALLNQLFSRRQSRAGQGGAEELAATSADISAKRPAVVS